MSQDSRNADRARTARPGTRVGIVVSSYHAELTGAMCDSAKRELAAGGVAAEHVHVVTAPGAFELPLVARRLARRPDIDAVLCFGLVLKGETTHDEHVARGASEGIARVMLDVDKPVLLGVLTCQTIEQARARALPVELGGRDDKGREVARAALELLATLDALNERPERPVGFRHVAGPPPTPEPGILP